MGQGQTLIHLAKTELQLLYEQSGYHDLLQEWSTQQNSYLVPATIVATALQAAEVATAAVITLPFGQEQTDPIRRARRQRLFWDRLKTICPRGTFYHGPLLQSNGQECRTALEYDEAMLATRDFWFHHPVKYDPAWADALAVYRQHTSPWPPIPEPTIQDYTEQLRLHFSRPIFLCSSGAVCWLVGSTEK